MRRISTWSSSSLRNELTPTISRRPSSTSLLEAVGGLGDLALEEVLVERRDDAAEPVDALEVVVGLALEPRGQRLDEPRAAERVGRVDDARLVRDHLLRAKREAGGALGRQRERLVVGVRVQRLRAAEHRRQRLERRPHDVDLGLLGRQRDACGLRVEAHEERALALGAVAVAQLARPDPAGRAVLRDLLEEVDVRVEEEREPRREVVDVHPPLAAGLDVGEPVGQRERQLLGRGRPRLADVVPRDRDRVPARHRRRCTTRSCRP